MINDDIRKWDGDRGCYIVYADDYDALISRLAEAERESEWLRNELGIAINELNAIAHDHDADARSLRLSAADAVIRYNADLKARATDSASDYGQCECATSGADPHLPGCPAASAGDAGVDAFLDGLEGLVRRATDSASADIPYGVWRQGFDAVAKWKADSATHRENDSHD